MSAWPTPGYAPPSEPPTSSRVGPLASGAVLFLLVGALALFLTSRFGVASLALAAAGSSVLVVVGYVSLKDLTLALMAWMLCMSGFRTLGMVRMPGLPDFSFDRLFLLWIILMFMLRTILERRKLKGPYLADVLLLLHTTYILVQLSLVNPVAFHSWVLSNLSPFFAYLYGKNIINREREIRNVLVFFLLLTLYYSVTSIAEHFGWSALIWPKAILNPLLGFWAEGRSRGPFLHPPLFGQILGIVLLVPFFFLIRPLRLVPRLGLSVLLGLGLLGLFFTMTRGPWLAVAAAVLLMGVLRPRYRRVLATMAALGAIGGLVGVTQLANTEFLQERVRNTHTIDNRLGFMANALRMTRDHPLTGIGYFKFPAYRGLYNQTTYIPLYGLVRKSDSATIAIHDIYIGRLAEEGIISALLLAAFGLVIFRAFLRQWRADPNGPWFNRDSLALFGAMMVCYLIGGMVIDFRYFDLVNVLFFFVAGLVYGYRPSQRSLAPRRVSFPSGRNSWLT